MPPSMPSVVVPIPQQPMFSNPDETVEQVMQPVADEESSSEEPHLTEPERIELKQREVSHDSDQNQPKPKAKVQSQTHGRRREAAGTIGHIAADGAPASCPTCGKPHVHFLQARLWLPRLHNPQSRSPPTSRPTALQAAPVPSDQPLAYQPQAIHLLQQSGSWSRWVEATSTLCICAWSHRVLHWCLYPQKIRSNHSGNRLFSHWLFGPPAVPADRGTWMSQLRRHETVCSFGFVPGLHLGAVRYAWAKMATVKVQTQGRMNGFHLFMFFT